MACEYYAISVRRKDKSVDQKEKMSPWEHVEDVSVTDLENCLRRIRTYGRTTIIVLNARDSLGMIGDSHYLSWEGM